MHKTGLSFLHFSSHESISRFISVKTASISELLYVFLLYSFGSAFGVCRALKSCDSAALTAPTVLCFSALKMQKPLMTNPAKEKASCVSIGAFLRRFKQCLKPPYSLRRLGFAFNLQRALPRASTVLKSALQSKNPSPLSVRKFSEMAANPRRT